LVFYGIARHFVLETIAKIFLSQQE
jgi:hypothetical protein